MPSPDVSDMDGYYRRMVYLTTGKMSISPYFTEIVGYPGLTDSLILAYGKCASVHESGN